MSSKPNSALFSAPHKPSLSLRMMLENAPPNARPAKSAVSVSTEPSKMPTMLASPAKHNAKHVLMLQPATHASHRLTIFSSVLNSALKIVPQEPIRSLTEKLDNAEPVYKAADRALMEILVFPANVSTDFIIKIKSVPIAKHNAKHVQMPQHAIHVCQLHIITSLRLNSAFLNASQERMFTPMLR